MPVKTLPVNKLTLLSLSLLLPYQVYAFGILDAYALALEKDPIFRSALKEREAGQENKNIARSGLLPQVSINYQNSPRNWQTQKYQQPDIFGRISEVTRRQQYRSYSSSVVLTQPLFDYEAYARYKTGVVQAQLADRRYQSQYLDLAVRVVTAYVDAASAIERMSLAQKQVTVLEEQSKLNQYLYQGGEGTITDISETEARHSLAKVQLIDARDALDAAQRALESIIGITLVQLDEIQTLRPGKFHIMPLTPDKYEHWESLAIKHNPVLAISRKAIQVAKYEVESNRAGFMPQVQLVAVHSENDSNSDNTVNQKYRTSSIGLRINVPIYSGGRVSASFRQARAKYSHAIYEKDKQVNITFNELRKHYNACASSKVRLAAYELAEKAASLQVMATRKSILAGQRVNIDILNAEQQLFSTQKDMAEAKYNYIKAWVNLMNYAGVLNEKDLLSIAQYFK